MGAFARRVAVLGASSCVLLAGCQILGPTAIDNGRDRYNSVIQSTSMEQTLANLVRVYHHEQTVFMDVTEVDAAQSFAGNASGASSNIGARHGTTGGTIEGQIGSAQGSIQYSESPTIRYQPLLGQSLVAQLVTPISVDVLADLYSSQPFIAPVLNLAVPDDLTPNVWSYEPALAAMRELRMDQAVRFAAIKSQLTKAAPENPAPPQSVDTRNTVFVDVQCSSCSKSSGSSSDSATAKKSDTLAIYLRPFSYADRHVLRDLKLWIRLLRIYQGTQPKFTPKDADACTKNAFDFIEDEPNGKTSAQQRNGSHNARARVGAARAKKTTIGGFALSDKKLKDWEDNMAQKSDATKLTVNNQVDPVKLTILQDCLPDSIELRAAAVSSSDARQEDLKSTAPVISTSSAAGLLRAALERPGPKVEFVRPEAYRTIRHHKWNQSGDEEEWNQPGDQEEKTTDQDHIDVYTLLPSDEDSVDCDIRKATFGCDDPLSEEEVHAGGKSSNPNCQELPDQLKTRRCIDQLLTSWISHGPRKLHSLPGEPYYPGGIFTYEERNKDPLTEPNIENINVRLGSLWRYMLIVRAQDLPDQSVYAAYHDKDGYWYYISGDDYISQRNFQLITLFLTMMAVPSAVPPLSPTINVGG